ncbi:MAG: FeS-binding protein [Candidatus Rokuibacteriota bacterium]|nr:MAG: FeS-binding protein [Candidatus Rokubacteria bacterium]PYN25216.1 MAG: FeS-binding protein [Candidatus Rokubacteria bacterium]
MTRTRVRLTFPSNLIQEPILYHLVKDFDIVINIRRADVKEDYGWVALEMEAGEDTLARGVKWLKDKGVQVDPIERDVIA